MTRKIAAQIAKAMRPKGPPFYRFRVEMTTSGRTIQTYFYTNLGAQLFALTYSFSEHVNRVQVYKRSWTSGYGQLTNTLKNLGK
jgi:hypothetical protein